MTNNSKTMLLLILTIIIFNGCRLFDTTGAKTPISFSRLYGKITADGIDITAEIQAAEYTHISGTATAYEFTPAAGFGVEFSGWYSYQVSFLTDNNTLLTKNNILEISDFYSQYLYVDVLMPDIQKIIPDAATGNLLVSISNNTENYHRKIILTGGDITEIISVNLPDGVETDYLYNDRLYYSSAGALKSFSLINSISGTVYNTNINDQLIGFKSGHVLYVESFSDNTAEYKVINLETGTIKTYSDNVDTERASSSLSGSGDVIITTNYSDVYDSVYSINIDTGIKIQILPPISNTRYFINDCNLAGSDFSYTAESQGINTENNSITCVTACMLHSETGELKTEQPAIFAAAGKWVYYASDAAATECYEITPETGAYVKTFSFSHVNYNTESISSHFSGGMFMRITAVNSHNTATELFCYVSGGNILILPGQYLLDLSIAGIEPSAYGFNLN